MNPAIERTAKLTLLLAMLSFIAVSGVTTNREETKLPDIPETASTTSVVSSGDAQAATLSPPIATERDKNTAQSSLLSEGRLAVDVMELATPPRTEELLARMQTALSQNQEWFLGHVKANSVPGQPLPYDKRMGLSEAEYRESLSLSKQMVYRKAGQAELMVGKTDRGSFLLDGGSSLPEVTGIEVDFTNKRIVTRHGALDNQTIVDAPSTTALGAWHGYQWEKQIASQQHVLSTDFALGRLSSSGRGVLLYDVKEVDSDGQRTRIDIVVTFDVVPETLTVKRRGALVR